jgi:putative membrane protein
MISWPISSPSSCALVLAVLLLSAVGVRAEEGNSAGMERAEANAADRVFVEALTRGGLAEIALGRLAQQQARNDVTRDFAKRMVTDHDKANEKLAALAKEADIVVPKQTDKEHKDLAVRLEKLSRDDFDAQYLAVQVGEHQKTVQLLSYEMSAGQDKGLVKFASETLAVVLGHLDASRMALDEIRSKTQ